MNVKEFLYRNKLKQRDLAAFLGVTEGSVSKMVNGYSRPSTENLHKLLNNDRGWDTSALTQEGSVNQYIGNGSSGNTQVAGSEEVAVLRERVRLLEQLLAEKERLITVLMGKTEGQM